MLGLCLPKIPFSGFHQCNIVKRFPDIVLVELHSFLAFVQDTGDFLAGSPLREQLNHIPLPWGHFCQRTQEVQCQA